MMIEKEIRSKLKTRVFGNRIHCLDEIDSTNSYAKSLAANDAAEGTVVIAETQRAGRGRFDRKWVSAPGKNLTFSLILRPTLSPKSLGVISIYAGLAVAKMVSHITGKEPACKWPNDVMLDGRKVSGILSESVFTGESLSALVVGIGLNVNQTEFSHADSPNATSLALACGREFDRSVVLAELLQMLEELYVFVEDENLPEIVTQWKRYSSMMGTEIILAQHRTQLRGIASGIDNDGALLLNVDGKEMTVFSGEVTVIGSHHS